MDAVAAATMGNTRRIVTISCCVLVVFSAFVQSLNVSYDHRALLLDGKRRVLISAGIHYPRATPEEWPNIIALAQEGGANVIQTYVFWSGHEPQKGQYNFEGRYDLVKFIRTVEQAGLYLNLRIGPYVCAEWNLGGFPTWLRHLPGVEFRTNNEVFKDEMAKFVKVIVDLMKEEELFAWQGGPIILAQIENEYGNIEWNFGEPGKQYIKWAAEFAVGLDSGVPWIMCQQWDRFDNIITTCNGYYCDGYVPTSPGTPVMWTENWSGWYQTWGSHVPHRPAEDIAYAVARFFEQGGSYQNYYMYFGGTNFERTAGGPYITTSYGYDAPIDEYGFKDQPKWGHLRDLHEALYVAEAALFASDSEPEYISFGPNLEAHVYSSSSPRASGSAEGNSRSETCLAFLANTDDRVSAFVNFRGRQYDLPAWSVSILPDCETVVFNTAKVGAQTSVMRVKRQPRNPIISRAGVQDVRELSTLPDELDWESHFEPTGVSDKDTITTQSLLEQIRTTKDLTDYLWYVTRFQVSNEDAEKLSTGAAQARLVLDGVSHAMHIFVNGEIAGSVAGLWVPVNQPVTLHEGENEIALLSMTVGLTNYGAFLEKESAGVRGSVQVVGLPSGALNLTTADWLHQPGLQGERLRLSTESGASSVSWISANNLPAYKPLIWYKTTFWTPAGKDPISLDLGSMGKGQLYVNGHHLGRYWPTFLSPEDGCTDSCDYRGVYNPGKCVTDCGEPTQRWHFIPREYLKKNDENFLVLFEEMGGDPSKVSLSLRSEDTICASISESHPAPVSKWLEANRVHPPQALVPELTLECAGGRRISQILFAGFGNSSGTCGKSFRRGNCHASTSYAVVEKACQGKSRCAIPVSTETFGEDPCPGEPKSLTVQAICRDPDNDDDNSSSIESYLHKDEDDLIKRLAQRGSKRWQWGGAAHSTLLRDTHGWHADHTSGIGIS